MFESKQQPINHEEKEKPESRLSRLFITPLRNVVKSADSDTLSRVLGLLKKTPEMEEVINIEEGELPLSKEKGSEIKSQIDDVDLLDEEILSQTATDDWNEEKEIDSRLILQSIEENVKKSLAIKEINQGIIEKLFNEVNREFDSLFEKIDTTSFANEAIEIISVVYSKINSNIENLLFQLGNDSEEANEYRTDLLQIRENIQDKFLSLKEEKNRVFKNNTDEISEEFKDEELSLTLDQVENKFPNAIGIVEEQSGSNVFKAEHIRSPRRYALLLYLQNGEKVFVKDRKSDEADESSEEYKPLVDQLIKLIDLDQMLGLPETYFNGDFDKDISDGDNNYLIQEYIDADKFHNVEQENNKLLQEVVYAKLGAWFAINYYLGLYDSHVGQFEYNNKGEVYEYDLVEFSQFTEVLKDDISGIQLNRIVDDFIKNDENKDMKVKAIQNGIDYIQNNIVAMKNQIVSVMQESGAAQNLIDLVQSRIDDPKYIPSVDR